MFFVFCIFILPITILLILLLSTRQKTDSESPSTAPMEVCALCQKEFPMNQLVEKEIGTYGRVYCFCGECIETLYNEFKGQTDIKQENK
ncbi:MAG: hypothetical protein OXI67_09340 [Candidatus Poribacteria bacterium]|nr:hypothetical protein [Candidatus Poribacteria bacterium]